MESLDKLAQEPESEFQVRGRVLEDGHAAWATRDVVAHNLRQSPTGRPVAQGHIFRGSQEIVGDPSIFPQLSGPDAAEFAKDVRLEAVSVRVAAGFAGN